MNDLQIFSNIEFGYIRTTVIDDQIWFVGKDVAEALGYENSRKAIRDHVDNEDKKMGEQNVTPSIIDSLGREQYPTFINESGLYALILSSKLPTAKKFKHWVTSEVLPSIRKNGGYISNQENLTSEQILANAVLLANNVIAEKDKQIERMRPKEIFADAVSASKTSILIGDLAKLLKQNGYETGQKRLFEQLRNEGFLIKSGNSKNMPTQRAMEQGLFEVKETTIANPDGSVRVTKTTKVTGKGQQYFINRYLKIIEIA